MTERSSSLTVGLVRYEEAPGWPGYLLARSAKSEELLFVTQVYPQRETKPVAFVSITHDPKAEALTIIDDAKRTHVVSVKEKERGSHWPARVELVKASPLIVRLTIPNLNSRPLALDEPTVCSGGEVSNHVFRLTAGGKPLAYRGEMAKRAPPDSFVMVKPGQSYQVEVPLEDSYAVPAKGELTIRFESFNHFSKDEVQFVSNELVVQR